MEILDRDVDPSGVLLLTMLARWLSPPSVSLSWSSAKLGESGTRTNGSHREQSEGSQETVDDFLVVTNPTPLTWTHRQGGLTQSWSLAATHLNLILST